jgi:hypothetical protein
MWAFLLCSVGVVHAEVVRHALVIGVNKGSQELDPLQYAGEDAVRIAEVLGELGGFPSDNVTLLFDPDRAQLDEALAQHAKIAAASDEDLFFFYYSGHADSTGLRLGKETVSYAELKDRIEAIPAEVRLGVLDACQAGGITREKGMVATAPFASQADLLTEGDAWITASAADEAAQESDSLRGSFFTHYLISGLRGAADRGDDGVVSLDEAYAYAYDRTVARTGTTQRGVQHPAYDFRLQGNGDLPLTEVDRASAQVIFPDDLAGVITVLQLPDETPIAEVAKREGEPAKLGLLPGRYRLRLRDDSGVREALIGLDAGAELTVRGFEARDTDLASAKGGDSDNIAQLDPLPNDPWVAGALSIVPGVGQAYNHQWWKGGVFLGATLVAGGTIWGPGNLESLVSRGSAWSAMPLMIWGWSIADAANVAAGGMHRADRGWAIGVGTTTYVDLYDARSASFEWYPNNRIAIGLSDLGVANDREDPTQLAYTGAFRTMVILSRGRHWQPALVGLGGVIVRSSSREFSEVQDTLAMAKGTFAPPDDHDSGDTLAEPAQHDTAAMLGGAFDLRYYATPRYFLEVETGGRSIDQDWTFATKLGLGVHFGR